MLPNYLNWLFIWCAVAPWFSYVKRQSNKNVWSIRKCILKCVIYFKINNEYLVKKIIFIESKFVFWKERFVLKFTATDLEFLLFTVVVLLRNLNFSFVHSLLFKLCLLHQLVNSSKIFKVLLFLYLFVRIWRHQCNVAWSVCRPRSPPPPLCSVNVWEWTEIVVVLSSSLLYCIETFKNKPVIYFYYLWYLCFAD